jgi:hypothetical protein
MIHMTIRDIRQVTPCSVELAKTGTTGHCPFVPPVSVWTIQAETILPKRFESLGSRPLAMARGVTHPLIRKTA